MVLTLVALVGIALAPLIMGRDILATIVVSFATGSLLAIILGHVIPKLAVQNRFSHDVAYYVVGGFVLMWLCKHYFAESETQSNHKLEVMTLGVLVLCAINDGVLLGNPHLPIKITSPFLWAVVCHKVVAALGVTMMVREKIKYKIPAFLLFVVLSPLAYGLMASNVFDFSQQVVDRLLALSSGVYLYVIAVNLIPQCNEGVRKFSGAVTVSLIMGIAATFYFVELGDVDGHVHTEECDHDHH